MKGAGILHQEHMDKKWWETSDLGRYCNHSLTPNTTVIYPDDRLELKANRKIESGEEILVYYRKVTEFTGYIPKINF
jgi:SET domain-containing protein